jgi:2-polyprenyl-6-methoxyphenol hydroxylase-like FAD-dependent oxidoreductase
LLLRQRGLKVDLYERDAPDVRPGHGITLRTDSLDFLGLGAEVPVLPLEGRRFVLNGETKLDLPRPPAVGLVGVSRAALIGHLRARCAREGVGLYYGQTLDVSSLSCRSPDELIVIAEGVASATRDAHATAFDVTISHGRNAFIWLGLDVAVEKMTIIADERAPAAIGWAYGYSASASTLIVEIALRDHDPPSGDTSLVRTLVERALPGAKLLGLGQARWRRFPTVSCRRLSVPPIVLLGDAGHTTHFSQGFGTLFAFDDARTLADCFDRGPGRNVKDVLAAFDALQTPRVKQFQEIASSSQRWSEDLTKAMAAPDPAAAYALVASRWADNLVSAAPLGGALK